MAERSKASFLLALAVALGVLASGCSALHDFGKFIFGNTPDRRTADRAMPAWTADRAMPAWMRAGTPASRTRGSARARRGRPPSCRRPAAR
ncbi:MAG TPA: hypothetical protein VIL20_31260 [Sandaracinaceae bacterium]